MNITDRMDTLIETLKDNRITTQSTRYAVIEQLLRDVIQEVLPEKHTEDRGLDAEMEAQNGLIDTINSNIDSLLTGEKQSPKPNVITTKAGEKLYVVSGADEITFYDGTKLKLDPELTTPTKGDTHE